jgi:hypothetical protein
MVLLSWAAISVHEVPGIDVGLGHCGDESGISKNSH